MSNQVSEMLDGKAIFEPSEDKKTTSKPDFVPTVEGDYYGHISKVTTRIVDFQNYILMFLRLIDLKFFVAISVDPP